MAFFESHSLVREPEYAKRNLVREPEHSKEKKHINVMFVVMAFHVEMTPGSTKEDTQEKALQI